MVQRDADLLALVLEDVDICDLGPGPELCVAIRPDVDQQPDALRRQLGERELVLGRVHHDLAAGGRRSDRPATDPVGAERRKAVLEHDHLERVERHLGSAAGPARTQRAEILGQECPVVALGRVGDPFAAQ